VERRLTTILAADVVGYSRLMGEDEAGTLVALKAHREAAINPKIAAHNGRIVKLMGDGLLTEFASVVEAVACAVEIQGAMAERNAEVPEDRRIQFRIGINVGDVMVEGDDIYGDGVNIAARLEGLAEPGGICVARNVFNQVKGKIDTAFEDLGEKEVKNIAEPVQVYRVSLSLPETAALKTGKTAPTLALPDKPSIAVLPFDNMSGDPDQAYFSDGMTEDIITELARFRSLFVIARNSSFAFRDRAVDVAEIGRQLGVQYVVEGSVRKAGNRVRVTAQLIDAATANHIWAERYDRDLDDIFAVQDEVVRTVVATLAGRLEQAGRESAKQKPPSNLGAYDFFLRGRNHFYHMSIGDNRIAQEMFAKAIELDPGYAPAHAGLAKSNFLDWFGGWSADLQASLQQGVALAEKAVALDDTDSRTHTALGWARLASRDYDPARFHLERALALNPSDTRAIVHFSRFLECTGEPDEAIDRLFDADRLNPFGKHGLYKGMAYYTARDYVAAIQALTSLRDPVALVRAWLAACYAQAGREDEARAEARQCDETARAEAAETGVSHAISWTRFAPERNPYRNPDDTDHLVEGLRKAGLE